MAAALGAGKHVQKMAKEYRLQKQGGSMHFIVLDVATVTKLTRNGNKRAICTLNGTERFHCAIMPGKQGSHYVNVGQRICRKLGVKEGDVVTATFEVDTSEHQFEMPEELAEVLDSDPEAKSIFDGLTPGNRRSLIYLVGLVKSADKKIERALKIATQIKSGITSPRTILK